MKNEKWLEIVKYKMATNEPIVYNNQSMPLLLKTVNDHQQIHTVYQDEQLQFERDDSNERNYCWRYIDPMAHLTHLSKNKRYLELILNDKYPNSEIILDNKILQEHGMNYHTVILSAVREYAANYDKYKHETNKLWECTTPYTLQCVVFLKDDGSYFCAVPCYYLTYELQLTNIDIIQTNVQLIDHILSKIPLIKMADHYPYPLVSPDSIQFTQDPLKSDGLTFNAYSTISTFSKERSVKAATFLQHVSNEPNYETSIDFDIYYLNDLDDMSTKLVAQELYHNITAKFDHNGNIVYHFKEPMPYWKTIISKIKFTPFSALLYYNTSISENLCGFNVYDHPEWEPIVYVMPKIVSDLFSVFNPQFSTKPITITNYQTHKNTGITPLVKDAQFNTLMVGMGATSHHKYYVVDNELITFWGSRQIDGIEKGTLL